MTMVRCSLSIFCSRGTLPTLSLSLLSSLELSDTKVYEPYIRASLGTTAQSPNFVSLNFRLESDKEEEEENRNPQSSSQSNPGSPQTPNPKPKPQSPNPEQKTPQTRQQMSLQRQIEDDNGPQGGSNSR